MSVRTSICAACCAALLVSSGFGTGVRAAEPKSGKPVAKTPAQEHDHPHEGPHGGSLIELGEEEYHAEIVLNEKTDTVVIHVLGANAKDLVPVEAPEVFINLKQAKKPKQYKLKSSPVKTDPKGQSSRFVLKDHDLMHDLHLEGAAPQLRVKISGKSYQGKIALSEHDHDHDHAEHASPGKKKS